MGTGKEPAQSKIITSSKGSDNESNKTGQGP